MTFLGNKKLMRTNEQGICHKKRAALIRRGNKVCFLKSLFSHNRNEGQRGKELKL